MKGQRGLFERPKEFGIWWIRYTDANGRERREKAGTKSSAKLLYQKRKQQALEGKKLPEKLRARTITFGELLDDAVEHCDRLAVAGSKKRYTCRVELIRNGLGSLAADAIAPQQIARWMSKTQRDNAWMPATANRYKALISLSFRLGIENGKCSSNPACLVRRLRENNERIRFLSEKEEAQLRKAIAKDCETRIADLDIALNTGMRQGEKYGLVWTDVDLIARRVTLRRTKNGSVRHIPLNQTAWSAFQSLWEKSTGEGRVFINAHGADPLLNPRYWWDAVVVEAKLADFHWHDLRHTFASRCIIAGVDLRTLQQLLGHKTLQMVVRYTHLSQSHELAAVERLCETREATGTRTGTSPEVPSDAEETRPN
ncbi:MAG: tyrosine-type recombinase/integrase [Acidobacteriaceae bacterium]